MKILLVLMVLVSLSSCAHHHNESTHHHHQYEKKCAYEVSQNHLNVEGMEEFKIDYEDKTYFFSSLEKKEKFQADIKSNIEKSEKNWRNNSALGTSK